MPKHVWSNFFREKTDSAIDGDGRQATARQAVTDRISRTQVILGIW
jgi:hypothetical protein